MRKAKEKHYLAAVFLHHSMILARQHGFWCKRNAKHVFINKLRIASEISCHDRNMNIETRLREWWKPYCEHLSAKILVLHLPSFEAHCQFDFVTLHYTRSWHHQQQRRYLAKRIKDEDCVLFYYHQMAWSYEKLWCNSGSRSDDISEPVYSVISHCHREQAILKDSLNTECLFTDKTIRILNPTVQLFTAQVFKRIRQFGNRTHEKLYSWMTNERKFCRRPWSFFADELKRDSTHLDLPLISVALHDWV